MNGRSFWTTPQDCYKLNVDGPTSKTHGLLLMGVGACSQLLHDMKASKGSSLLLDGYFSLLIVEFDCSEAMKLIHIRAVLYK